MMHNDHVFLVGGMLFSALAFGCGDEAPRSEFPYEPDETTVIGMDGIDTYGTPNGSTCLQIPDGDCVQPQDDCGDDATADVLLDSAGDVIKVVCLPNEGETSVVHVEDQGVVIPDNGAVVILDETTLNGDLTVEGNRAVIYGDSPELTVLDGDLVLKGNESLVRGVTVTGNVTFDGNTAELYHCVIEGDVVLKGSKNFISNCTVFGNITSSGNEDVVVSNYVQGEISFSGAPTECQDNKRFEDSDEDSVLDQTEMDAATDLPCD